MNTNDERNVDPIEEMLRLVDNDSKLATWGFKENYRSIIDKRLIYDSEWCRMKFVWGGWDYGSGNSISVYYGRLHAPNEKTTLIWNGEECHAWHEFEYVLHFLDGRSPTETSELDTSHSLTDKYYDDEFSQKFDRRQPEWLMQMHMEVWDHYGERLFELFDLRQPQLWEQYRKFLKEFYDIKGRLPFIKPAMDKVC
jgi:hypothetical protein